MNFSGSKSMQDGWGGGDRPTVANTRPPSWEEDDDNSMGLWNSTGTQESSSPYNSANWTSGGKKIHKVRKEKFCENKQFAKCLLIFGNLVPERCSDRSRGSVLLCVAFPMMIDSSWKL